MGNEQRQVSIITPCREVDLPLVEKLLRSLEQQTAGFDKAEWILVVHNSGSDYLKKVETLVAPYPNIRLYKLENEFHTPSSPKNYAMDKAKCPFIMFLDADDALAPDCIETALSYVTDEIDAVFFRYDTIREDDSTRLSINLKKPIGEGSVQYYECSTCNRDLMQGAELTTTAKLYRRSVLNDNNIRYDTEVPIAEDVFMNLHFLKAGRKFCFLQDYYGYIYYLRSDSAIQGFAEKTPEDVVRAGNGFHKILTYGLDNGLFVDNILLDLVGYESAMMLGCLGLSLKQRQELKKAYEPVIAKLADVQPSGRYDAKLLKTMKMLPKMVIMRPRLMQFVSAILRFFHVDMNEKIRSLNKEQ